jgi:hypothetical protein
MRNDSASGPIYAAIITASHMGSKSIALIERKQNGGMRIYGWRNLTQMVGCEIKGRIETLH